MNEERATVSAMPEPPAPEPIVVQGQLTERYRLVRPILVTIEQDEGEFIAAEDQFNMHGVGVDLLT